jgi:hypothetical protein
LEVNPVNISINQGAGGDVIGGVAHPQWISESSKTAVHVYRSWLRSVPTNRRSIESAISRIEIPFHQLPLLTVAPCEFPVFVSTCPTFTSNPALFASSGALDVLSRYSFFTALDLSRTLSDYESDLHE